MPQSKRVTLESLCDGILTTCLIAPLVVMLALASICTLESDVEGTCVITALEPFFTFMVSLFIFIAMLGGLIYYPAILASYIGSTAFKIGAWSREGKAAIAQKPIGWGIWASSTVVFLGIAILVIIEIAFG